MEEREQKSFSQEFSKNSSSQNISEEENQYYFNKRKKEQSTKSMEDIVNELYEEASGVSKDSDSFFGKFKSSFYSFANKFGFNLYSFDIQRSINLYETTLNTLVKDKSSLESELYGDGSNKGLFDKKNSFSKDVTAMYNLISNSYLAIDDLNSKIDSLDKKIDVFKQKGDFEAESLLVSQKQDLTYKRDMIENKILDYKFEFENLIDEHDMTSQEIDRIKFTLNHLKKNITPLKFQLSKFKRFIGEGSNIKSYVKIAKLLESSVKDIVNLTKVNSSIDEKTYFASDSVMNRMNSYSGNSESNYINEIRQKSYLNDKQNSIDDRDLINQKFNDFLKR